MWVSLDHDTVRYIYSKLDINEHEIPKIFNDLEWHAILESGSGNNVSQVSRWFRVPKGRKKSSIGRFQHLIYDDPSDENENGQTDRWRDLFKKIITNLKFHSDKQNIIQIGFSILAQHPIKFEKQQPNAYVYVSTL